MSVTFDARSARFVYASMARLAVIKFVHYMNASADVLALASIEVPPPAPRARARVPDDTPVLAA